MEKKKILVADDEERIVKLVSDFLTAAGYEAVTAADGGEGLAVVGLGGAGRGDRGRDLFLSG